MSYAEPPSGERIVGFYGRNYFGENMDGIVEFGIITAPSGVELPVQVYDMPQLQNTDGGLTVSGPRARAASCVGSKPPLTFVGSRKPTTTATTTRLPSLLTSPIRTIPTLPTTLPYSMLLLVMTTLTMG